MAKRKKNSSNRWVLRHEIYLPANRSRSETGRRDVVTWALINFSGKILQTKKIPSGAIKFGKRDDKRHMMIDSDFLKEIDQIETIRHYEEKHVGFITSEHSVVA